MLQTGQPAMRRFVMATSCSVGTLQPEVVALKGRLREGHLNALRQIVPDRVTRCWLLTQPLFHFVDDVLPIQFRTVRKPRATGSEAEEA
jgi:hypothetical protein